ALRSSGAVRASRLQTMQLRPAAWIAASVAAGALGARAAPTSTNTTTSTSTSISTSISTSTSTSISTPTADLAYAGELVARARGAGLARSDEWAALLHLRKLPLRALRSEAERPAFFFAPDGKTDPEAETEATLPA